MAIPNAKTKILAPLVDDKHILVFNKNKCVFLATISFHDYLT